MVVAHPGEPCPGCGARYPSWAGPTHEYIGASAACWALYSAFQMGCDPEAGLVEQSHAPWTLGAVPVHPVAAASASLLVDAYAAQHHGTPSPRAIQSVAVHLLVLHSVFRRSEPVERALWVRRRALRTRGVFAWLSPPPLRRAYSIRHLVGAPGANPVVTVGDYVASVYAAWSAEHEAHLSAWYDRFVVSD